MRRVASIAQLVHGPWTEERIREEIQLFKSTMDEIVATGSPCNEEKYTEYHEHTLFPVAIEVIALVNKNLDEVFEYMGLDEVPWSFDLIQEPMGVFSSLAQFEAAKVFTKTLTRVELTNFANLCITRMFNIPRDMLKLAEKDGDGNTAYVFNLCVEEVLLARLDTMIDEQYEYVPGLTFHEVQDGTDIIHNSLYADLKDYIKHRMCRIGSDTLMAVLQYTQHLHTEYRVKTEDKDNHMIKIEDRDGNKDAIKAEE